MFKNFIAKCRLGMFGVGFEQNTDPMVDSIFDYIIQSRGLVEVIFEDDEKIRLKIGNNRIGFTNGRKYYGWARNGEAVMNENTFSWSGKRPQAYKMWKVVKILQERRVATFEKGNEDLIQEQLSELPKE